MIKLQFLGSGSAFVPISENYQSNMILQSESGKRLLIDCGTDARHSITPLGLSQRDIDCVYISHHHADHVGGLEWLAFTTYFDPAAKKPSMMIHPSLVDRLWNNVLSGGLQSLEGDKPATLDDYFDILPCNDDDSFTWESIHIHLIKTIHVYNGHELLPSYGLFFKTDKNTVFISTDTQFKPELYMQYYHQADIIFHDCETTAHKGCVHAHFTQLATLDPAIKAKMWLYHYSTSTRFDAVANGFRGFVAKGQSFML